MAALVLMNALMLRPEAVADVRVAEDRLDAVPVRDPDRVGQCGTERRDVADRRGGAAVDAGDEAVRAQLGHPAGDERLHRPRAGGVCRLVALHVEVHGAARGQAEAGGKRRGVVGGGPALCGGGRGRRRDLLQPRLADARRLQADVERQQAPPHPQRRRHPRRRQVLLRAAAVRAADVDPERPVRRGGPGLERVRRRRGARVEAVAGVDLGAGALVRGPAGGREGQERGGESREDERPPSHGRQSAHGM